MKFFLRRKKYLIIILGFFIVTFGVSLREKSFYDHKLHVTFFDVGQGDSILLQYDDFFMLVDGGTSKRISSQIGKKLPFFSRDLDLVVVTHPEKDHFGGLVELSKKMKIEKLLVSKKQSENEEYNKWLQDLGRKKIPILLAHEIDSLHVNETFHIDILHPKGEQDMKSTNDRSVVLLVHFRDIEILLTGDISEVAENILLESYGKKLDVEILKVAHHGSDTSSGKKLLEVISPEVAIISVGRKNWYGHPSGRVLYRLEEVGAKILRTDELGDIEIKVDEKGYNFVPS